MYSLFLFNIWLVFCISYTHGQLESITFDKDTFPYSVDCSYFFHGSPWPMLKNIDGTRTSADTVKLCQTENIDDEFDNPLYATLLNTTSRIPVYSANRVILREHQHVYPRPEESFWNRVATGLCDLNVLPKSSILSNLDHVDSSDFEKCRRYQAVSADYHDNGMHLDRGHLSPNHINSRNEEKQRGTFTLTNAAPQYAEFNRNSWRVFECVTEYAIIDLVPGEPVYIITGTYGSAVDEQGHDIWLNLNQPPGVDKNPVKVPGFYWKAVCYPGNKSGKKPWAYALIEKNINEHTEANFADYVTVKDFAQKYFVDPPFGDDCMNAGFGEFANIFDKWDQYVEQHCGENKIFFKNHH